MSEPNNSTPPTIQSRIASYWLTLLLGIIICITVGFILNKSEKRSKTQNAGVKEALSDIISVDDAAINPENQDHLVHLSGSLQKTSVLIDEVTGVEVNALSLRRKVQMFQYVEKEEQKQQRKYGPRKIGDEQGEYETVTEYKYKGEWHDVLINDENFHNNDYHNPNKFPVETKTWQSNEAQLGAFSLSNELFSTCVDFEPYQIGRIERDQVKTTSQLQNVQYLEQTTKYPARIYMGRGSKESPDVGAVIISYEILPVGNYSVVGKQNNNLIEPYKTSIGTTVALMSSGIIDSKKMLESSQLGYSILTWLFRGIAFFVIFLGSLLILRPFTVFKTGVFGVLLKPGLFVSSIISSLIISILIIELTWMLA